MSSPTAASLALLAPAGLGLFVAIYGTAALLAGVAVALARAAASGGAARAVQIDIDPGQLSLRYPCEVNRHGDAADTLRALLPLPLSHRTSDVAFHKRSRTPRRRLAAVLSLGAS